MKRAEYIERYKNADTREELAELTADAIGLTDGEPVAYPEGAFTITRPDLVRFRDAGDGDLRPADPASRGPVVGHTVTSEPGAPIDVTRVHLSPAARASLGLVPEDDGLISVHHTNWRRLSDENAKLRADLAAAERRLFDEVGEKSRVMDRCGELSQQLQQAEAKLANAVADLAAMTAERDEAVAERDDLADRLERAECAEQERDAAWEIRDAAIERAEKAERERDEAKRQLTLATNTLDGIASGIIDHGWMRPDVVDQRIAEARAEERNEALHRVSVVDARRDDLARQLADARSTIEELQVRVSEAERERDEARDSALRPCPTCDGVIATANAAVEKAVAEEREACLKACRRMLLDGEGVSFSYEESGYNDGVTNCIDALVDRGRPAILAARADDVDPRIATAVAEEREACAKLAENHHVTPGPSYVAKVIRARADVATKAAEVTCSVCSGKGELRALDGNRDQYVVSCLSCAGKGTVPA